MTMGMQALSGLGLVLHMKKATPTTVVVVIAEVTNNGCNGKSTGS